MLDVAGGDLLKAASHSTQRPRCADPIGVLALVVGLVVQQQRDAAPGVAWLTLLGAVIIY